MSKKVAYVTGGMGGIGTAICQRLAREGFTVIAGCGPSRDYGRWLAGQKALGYEFFASVGNVADWDSTVEAFAKARAVVWNFPDAIPLHREPIYSNRPDLVAKYPTHDDKKAFWRLPTLYKTAQQKNVADKVHEKYPIVLTSGRLVEYEGGGEETRSNPWLAELQQENFVEINPKDAESRGVKYWDYVWVSSPTGARIKVRALVTERVGPGVSFIPFHFAGWWQGKDLLDKYPEGAAPIVRGEAVNTATTYGYDSVTMMQETKTTLCQIERA